MEIGSIVTTGYEQELLIKNGVDCTEHVKRVLCDKVAAEIFKLYEGEVKKSRVDNLKYEYTLRLWVKPYDGFIENFKEASRAIRRAIKEPSLEEHVLAIMHHHLLQKR